MHVIGKQAECHDCVIEPLASTLSGSSKCCSSCRYANCKRLRELVNLVIVGEHNAYLSSSHYWLLQCNGLAYDDVRVAALLGRGMFPATLCLLQQCSCQLCVTGSSWVAHP